MSVLRTQFGALARRPSRLLLTGLALIVAAFVVFGVVLARQSTRATVLDNFSGTPEAADLVVTGSAVDGPAVGAVRTVPGVAEVVGRIASYRQLTGQSDWLLLRADPGTGPLSTVRLAAGSYPTAQHQIAVTQRMLDRMHLALGDAVGVEVPVVAPGAEPGTGTDGEPAVTRVELKITGVVRAPDDTGREAYAPDALILPLVDPGSVTQIEVRLAPGARVDAVRTAITAAVTAAVAAGNAEPGSGRAEAPTIRTGVQARTAEMRRAVDEVDVLFAIIGIFVAIAIAAAALVATSTFRIVFAQRMRQLALLRAVGAGRGALVRALLAEGVLTGIVAGVVGVAAAAACAWLVPLLLAAFDIEVSGTGLPLLPAALVVLGTATIATIAVLAPAWSASRVAPLEALRASATTTARRGIGVFRALVGILLALGAGLLAGLVVASIPEPGSTGGSSAEAMLLIIVGSGTLAYFALVALGPVLLAPVLAVVGWPVRRLGALGRLAASGVGGAPRRAAAVSVVVALGVTLIAGVLIGGASLRVELERQMAAMAPADFLVTAVRGDKGGTDGADGGTFLAAGALDRIRQRSEVEHVVPYRGATVSLGTAEGTFQAVDLDLDSLPTRADFTARSGSLDRIGPGRAIVFGALAEVADAEVGSTVTVHRAGHRIDLRVVATLPATPLDAALIVDPADLDRLGVPAGCTGVLADAAGAGERGRTAAYDALRTAAGGRNAAFVTAYADFRESTYRELNAVIWIALGLIAMTVLVAVVGVGTTAALSVVERVREAGMLRAVGMSRGGLRTMLTLESGLYGIVGAALGLLLAVPYSWLTIVTASRDFPVRFPVWQLACVVVVLTGFTALAGTVPARRASRVPPVAALGAAE